MQEFYTRFYAATQHSPVHAEFCERVFGLNLGQHGFVDMAQLDAMLRLVPLSAEMRVLEVGCGNGMIAEYISDRTGAQITGIDYIPAAIEQAEERTASRRDRLRFVWGDINALDLPPAEFDAILSLDSIYFGNDYMLTIRQLARALQPRGQMAIFYSYGREPWVPKEEFQAGTLPPDRTPLAEALKANGLDFDTIDLTQEDYRLALLRRHVLRELRPRFEAEDLMFIYDNRMGDALGVSQAIEEGLHARYLYHVWLPG